MYAMKPTLKIAVALLFLELFAVKILKISFCNGSSQVGCIKSERQALLSFKQGLTDPSNRLASWIDDGDCCSWNWGGTVCDSFKGHVVELSPDCSSFYFSTTAEYEACQKSDLAGKISGALGNLTFLRKLDLSNIKIEGGLPRSFSKLCNLKSISLVGTKLTQDISEILDILSVCISDRLERLDLHDNQLFGRLTSILGQFKNLDTLDLSGNSITGSIPTYLGELSSLRYLVLSNNKLNGTLSEIHFNNLTRLLRIYASGNSLMFNVSHDWVPPFQLTTLDLASCHLGPRFPMWLRSQKKLVFLDLSNSGISDTISNWFWEYCTSIQYLTLSHNQIHGQIPDLTEATQFMSIDLSWNDLSGTLPLISFNLGALDLSNNALSGSSFQFLCNRMNESKAGLGPEVLKLGDNFLSGELPDCWINWQTLTVLNLGNNKFTGSLPASLGTLTSLQSLRLRKNNFSGTIPRSLKNCTELIALDVGENEFVGNVPTWIGKRFSSMIVLNLRLNKFHGFLPVELCHLARLQILDLAYNNLFGRIPRCINNLSAMVTVNSSTENSIPYSPDIGDFIEDSLLVIKGKTVEYSRTLNLVRIIDLSKNKFSGDIAVEVTDLKALLSLNLSHNSFSGRIPENIGAMRLLESMDLSTNQLYGEIPQSLSNLTFLNYLNLSNNKLTGEIPSSTQLQSLDASCFMGNELCGPPLPKNCTTTHPIPDSGNGGIKNGNEHEVDWLYVGMTFGFIVGFWSVIGPLIANRRWRYKYCHFLDCVGDKLTCAVRKFG